MNTLSDRWFIHRRLAEETNQRLQLVNLVPRHILLFGADGDCSRRLLAARYPGVCFSEYDCRIEFLQAAAAERQTAWWHRLANRGKTVTQYCQPLHMPLPEGSADWLWANLGLLPAADNPVPVLENWARALRADGLLFFTHFGLDTLSEVTGYLKELGMQVNSPFTDMHDLGDMLFHHGFYDPVMDTAQLRLDYQNTDTFWQDMDTLGIWPALQFENEAVARTAVEDGFAQGRLKTVTLETVYGHALKKLQLRENESLLEFYPRQKIER